MVGMGLSVGLGMRRRPPPQPVISNDQPELLLQAQILSVAGATGEGTLIKALAIPWLAIFTQVKRDPSFLNEFAANHRKFEEFLAASYDRMGYDVTLTPQRNDKGRDLIAVKKGFGSIRILEQAKAYSPGRLVTHDDLRSMLGTLASDPCSSKGIITTTSDFQPGIFKPDSAFAPFMPHRLELKNGAALVEWLTEIEKTTSSS